MTKIEFDATPSGDGDGFCYDVDAETYEKVCGKKPFHSDRARGFGKECYRLYPYQFMDIDVFKHHITIERDSDKTTIIVQEIAKEGIPSQDTPFDR